VARLEVMEGAHFWSVGRDRLTRLLIDRYHMDEPYLDAGAGTARFAKDLADEGRRVHWFDITHASSPGFRASIESIPMRSGSMGTILVRDVLEHVDDGAALAECYRVLRPGGHLLVTVPGWPLLWGPRDSVSGHLRRYTRLGLRTALTGHGLQVLELRGYQFFLLPLVVVARISSRRAGIEALRREESLGAAANRILTRVNLIEAGLGRWKATRPPTGSTLVAVAQRP
jgi:SAM-dependent methyltransferase